MIYVVMKFLGECVGWAAWCTIQTVISIIALLFLEAVTLPGRWMCSKGSAWGILGLVLLIPAFACINGLWCTCMAVETLRVTRDATLLGKTSFWPCALGFALFPGCGFLSITGGKMEERGQIGGWLIWPLLLTACGAAAFLLVAFRPDLNPFSGLLAHH